ncbi:hypothetical protein, partial [Vibrio sp.]|uniref:hypothetical protein n=1 Tax=Vibrio sp. TaxID=678 RepID=UPI003D13AC74
TVVAITNTYVPGCLNVTKDVVLGDVVNPAGISETFTVYVTGPSYPTAPGHEVTFTLTAGELVGDDYACLCDLIPGDYTVSEVDPGDAWDVTYVPADGTVAVGAGDTCADTVVAITNTYVPGCLNVTKRIDWQDAIPIDGVTFEICIVGPSYPTGTEPGACQRATYPDTLKLEWCGLIPGEYTIVETDPAITNPEHSDRWEEVVITVSPTMVLAGDPCATATVENTFIPYGCTLTWGYWKTHSEYGPAPYDDTWGLLDANDDGTYEGADEEFFGTGKTYYEILQTKEKGGNAYIILAHQYIATELTSLMPDNEDLPDEIGLVLIEAADLLKEYENQMNIPKRGPTAADRARAIELASILDNFNNGLYPGWKHCD